MAALFTVLLGLSALLLGYFLYDFGRQNFLRETEAAIDSEMKRTLSLIDVMSVNDIARIIEEKSQLEKQPIYLYIDANDNVLAGSLDTLPSDVERVKEGVIAFSAPLNNQRVKWAAKIHTFADGTRLLIARDMGDIVQSYNKLTWISAFIMVFMLIVVLVSFLISIFVVRRINIIASTAQQIMETGDLSQRISIQGNWDDLSNLAQILNTLLARVEALMEGIRDVSDSIAHDLRTPLTRIKHQLEDAKQEGLSSEKVAELLSEADQLLQTFNALLRISNVEKGKRHQAFCDVDIQAILNDVVELYDPLMQQKNIVMHIRMDKVKSVQGDRDLLFQLFANVLDNAVKFSPDNGHIRLVLSSEKKKINVSIADEGAGIAQDDIDKVFQRFYRADKSRHTAGTGLGLSLVKAIVEHHNGTIELADNQPGLRVAVIL